METVTGLDYRALVEARGTLLAEAERRYGHEHDPAQRSDEALRDGIVYQACKEAEHAIFGALNVLASYGGDAEALRVVYMRVWEEPS